MKIAHHRKSISSGDCFPKSSLLCTATDAAVI